MGEGGIQAGLPEGQAQILEEAWQVQQGYDAGQGQDKRQCGYVDLQESEVNEEVHEGASAES